MAFRDYETVYTNDKIVREECVSSLFAFIETLASQGLEAMESTWFVTIKLTSSALRRFFSRPTQEPDLRNVNLIFSNKLDGRPNINEMDYSEIHNVEGARRGAVNLQWCDGESVERFVNRYHAINKEAEEAGHESGSEAPVVLISESFI